MAHVLGLSVRRLGDLLPTAAVLHEEFRRVVLAVDFRIEIGVPAAGIFQVDLAFVLDERGDGVNHG